MEDINVDGMKASQRCQLLPGGKLPGAKAAVVMSVVLGTSTANVRESEKPQLPNYGLRFLRHAQGLQPPARSLQTLQAWKGQTEDDENRLQPVTCTRRCRKGQAGNIKATLTTQQPLVAPVSAGRPWARSSWN